MNSYFILKLDEEYYAGIYHGEVSTDTYDNCYKYETKEELIKEINSEYWISEDIKSHFKYIQVINILD